MRDAADSARILCDENFGFAPLVNVVDAEEPLRIQCIPTHLRACVWELLKNALRATAEAAKREEHRKKQVGVRMRSVQERKNRRGEGSTC